LYSIDKVKYAPHFECRSLQFNIIAGDYYGFYEITLNCLYKPKRMKKILMIVLLSAACSMAKAQFANTKWKGSLVVPDPLSVILDFKKDVIDVVSEESGEVLETMSYTVHADTLIFKKVSGQSACPDGSISKLTFKIAENKLMLVPASDDCQSRADVWTKEPFLKVKE
jgi:hypothetical protein